MGGPGGAENAKPDFRNPYTAVTSFLAALKKKDAELLKGSVALRSPTEAKADHQKMFQAILESNLAPDQIDELSRQFDGMQVIYTDAPMTETGKYTVRVGKRQGREIIERSLIVRKEKAGWKVLDVDKYREFTQSVVPGRGRMAPGRRR